MRDFKDYVPSRLQKIETMADMPKEKACKRCGFVKLNNFENFGKKWHKTRTNYVTVDICNTCKNNKISQTMTQKWESRREGDRFLSEELARKIVENGTNPIPPEAVDPPPVEAIPVQAVKLEEHEIPGPPEGAKPVDPEDVRMPSKDPFDWS